MKRILLAAMVFVLSSVQAHAQRSCSDFTIGPSQQIAACTSMITSFSFTGGSATLLITRADRSPFNLFINRGAAFARKGEIEASKADFRHAIEMTTKSLEEGGKPLPREYNNRCWARAVANVELDLALMDCNEALRSAPRNPAGLDSRAFVYLRLGRNEDAIRDYDAALARARRPNSLYGRGVAKLRLGDVEGAKADLFLAETLGPGTRAEFIAFGVTD